MSINYRLSRNDEASVIDTSPATGALTNTELRASAVLVTATSLPLPSGASTNTELVNLQGITLDAASSNNTRLDTLNANITNGTQKTIVTGTVATTLSGNPAVSVSNFPASQAVTGAFFQATQPVSVAGSVAVTGPLTDVQIRASAVPVSLPSTTVTNTVAVSGAFYQTTQPVSVTGTVTTTGSLTDAQLRAAAVPVSLSSTTVTNTVATTLASTTVTNTVAVTGVLTDTQIRATPLPISGTVTANTGLSQPLTDAQMRASAIPTSSASLPLPAGASTSALQSNANTFLTSIDTKTPALGQALAAASTPVVLTAAQVVTLTPPTTITANAGTNLNTSLLALDSTIAKDASLTTLNASVNTLLKPASTLAAVTSVGTVGAVTAITNTVTIKADVLANQTTALKVADGLGSSGINGNLSLATANTAYEAKVSITRLANRKSVSIQAFDNDIFWGYTSAVTASTGTVLFKNQSLEFASDPGSSFQIWLVCAVNNRNARIAEST